MTDLKAKMHRIWFLLALRPRPRWGSLQSTWCILQWCCALRSFIICLWTVSTTSTGTPTAAVSSASSPMVTRASSASARPISMHHVNPSLCHISMFFHIPFPDQRTQQQHVVIAQKLPKWMTQIEPDDWLCCNVCEKKDLVQHYEMQFGQYRGKTFRWILEMRWDGQRVFWKVTGRRRWRTTSALLEPTSCSSTTTAWLCQSLHRMWTSVSRFRLPWSSRRTLETMAIACWVQPVPTHVPLHTPSVGRGGPCTFHTMPVHLGLLQPCVSYLVR